MATAKHPRYVVGFMFNIDRTRVALIRKQRPDWQRGRLNGIGGHIELDETAWQAMVREFREETGYESFESDWEQVAVMSRTTFPPFECRVFRYLSAYTDLGEVLKSPTDECVEFCTVELLPPSILSNVGWLIELCLDLNPGDCPCYNIVAHIGRGQLAAP